MLQGKNIVGSLITRLTDSNEDVVVEATGTLRSGSPFSYAFRSQGG